MSSVPALALHQLPLYNTGRMSPEQVIAAFAARRQQFDRIVADIAAEKPRSRAQHHLIVGQRGMGKTMLLARIAAELRTNPDLSGRFIPLVFAEEQYAVDRLSKFWLNCLDSLADAREAAGDAAHVDEIDATVARLTAAGMRAVRDEQPFADEVYEAFAKAAGTRGQRTVLLVDNLQLVFERLDEREQHSLRELLMRPGSPILVGTSPSPPPQDQDYSAAFYDQFKIHYLRPLDEPEMRSLLVHLADTSGREDVRRRVLQHPARLKVLRQLTGGNPRTTLTLFFLYAEDFAPTVFGDLEGLLDRVTPLYKARFEELTPQQQVVTSAVANHWDPISAAAVAIATGLPAGTISAQLERLEKLGVVERTELFGDTRIGYQLAERFFNIWCLMRSASRRQRREVEFLTRFLESFYEPAERSRLARKLMDEDRFSPDRYVLSHAVAATVEPETAEELRRHTELAALREEAREARARLRELIDFDALPPATLAFDDLRKKLMALVPEGAAVTADDFAKAVLGDREFFKSGERQKLAARTGKLSIAEIESVLEVTEKQRSADELRYSAPAVKWFSQRLSSGQIRSLRDADDWNRAFHQASGSDLIKLMVDALPLEFAGRIDESSVTIIRENLRPNAISSAEAWREWGYVLDVKLDLDAESELACREALTLDPDDSDSWNDLGDVLANLNRFEEAEQTYRAAIGRDSGNTAAWIGLGMVLHQMTRLDEAEAAYREAIARNPDDPWAYDWLGDLLTDRQRFAEAEVAFRDAIARDPDHDLWWIDLGGLLRHLQRPLEAENAYREAIARMPSEGRAWFHLGVLLHNDPDRVNEAETAYREAVARDPNVAATWIALGNLYCDHFARFAEAAEAYERALELQPTNSWVHQDRLFLRRDFIGEGSRARPLMEELHAIPGERPDSNHLHEALFAAYESNWGLCREALGRALTHRADVFSPANTGHWLRATAVLVHLNYGRELLAFLDERGDTARLRPWVAAVTAIHIGDRRALQNFAPEIRTTAEIFYDGIESRLKKLPEKTRRRPLPEKKQVRKRRPGQSR